MRRATRQVMVVVVFYYIVLCAGFLTTPESKFGSYISPASFVELERQTDSDLEM